MERSYITKPCYELLSLPPLFSLEFSVGKHQGGVGGLEGGDVDHCAMLSSRSTEPKPRTKPKLRTWAKVLSRYTTPLH